jgi:hypothetical protein
VAHRLVIPVPISLDGAPVESARRLNAIGPRALAAVGRADPVRSLVFEPAGFRSLLGRRSTKALAVLSAAEGAGGYLEEVHVSDEPFDLAEESTTLNARLKAADLPEIALIDVTDEQDTPRRAIRSWV